MSLGKILILAILCLTGSWFLFLDKEIEQLSARQIISPSVASELKENSLSSISLSHPGEVFQIICSNNTQCALKDPPAEPIDKKAFTELVENLDSLKAISEISESQQQADGGDFGVSGAPLKIEIKGSSKTILYFGGNNPITNSRYLRIEGDPKIYVVDDAIFNKLLVKKRDIRPLHPLAFDQQEIVSLQSSTKKFSHLFLKEKGDWLLKNAKIDLDQDLIADLLKRVQSITTVEFVDNAPPILLQQLKNPYLVLDLTDQKQTKQRLSFYSVDISNLPGENLIQQLYFMAIAGRQTLYQILPPRLSDFNNQPLHFQDSTPFTDLKEPNNYTVAISASGNEVYKSSIEAVVKKNNSALDTVFSSIREIKLLSTTAPETSGEPTLAIELTDSAGKPARLQIFSRIASGNESQTDAPYLAKILYFSSIEVHAIIAAEQITALEAAVKSLTTTK